MANPGTKDELPARPSRGAAGRRAGGQAGSYEDMTEVELYGRTKRVGIRDRSGYETRTS